ncbi:MAG: DNA-3-methyladenine glycosylase [Spirochaetales bacterium]|nr:DNA-3-methyladenine glycosylase [Spirochaetales bacterium]
MISKTDFTLPYDPSFDYRSVLSFMTPRLIRGVESACDGVYSRTFRFPDGRGWLSLWNNEKESSLEGKIYSDSKGSTGELLKIIRRMFDLDRDKSEINKRFAGDPLLSRGMPRGRVPGLPVAFDPFEFTVRAILGQQITVQAATTLAGRIAERSAHHTGISFPDDLKYFFPTAEELNKTDLTGLGITATRQKTIKTVTGAVLENRISLSPEQSFEEFNNSFLALKGIGPWTVNYVAMRGLGMADAFPASDLGIIKALAVNGKRPTTKDIERQAEKWRPWRSYAALCIWHIN